MRNNIEKLFEIPHVETPDGDLDMGLEFLDTPQDFVEYISRIFAGERVRSAHEDDFIQLRTPEDKLKFKKELWDHPFFLMMIQKQFNVTPEDLESIIDKYLGQPVMESKRDKIVRMFCESTEKVAGGLADNKTVADIAEHHAGSNRGRVFTVMFYKIKNQLKKGIDVEMEHTNDPEMSKEIAKDHLWEDPEYYDKLEDMESS